MDNGFCMAHQPDNVKDSRGFGGSQEGSGRPRKPRLSELYAEVAEEMREKIREVLVEGLNADRGVVVGNGPTAHVEQVPDIPTRLKTAAEIADRTDGKPRQAIEHSGPEGGPMEVVPVTRTDAESVGAVLARVLPEDA